MSGLFGDFDDGIDRRDGGLRGGGRGRALEALGGDDFESFDFDLGWPKAKDGLVIEGDGFAVIGVLDARHARCDVSDEPGLIAEGFVDDDADVLIEEGHDKDDEDDRRDGGLGFAFAGGLRVGCLDAFFGDGWCFGGFVEAHHVLRRHWHSIRNGRGLA